MEWLAAIFLILIAIAAPYFTLIGGLMVLLGVAAFYPDIDYETAINLLIGFEIVAVLWIALKWLLSFFESRRRRKVMGEALRRRNARPAIANITIDGSVAEAFALFGLTPACTPDELQRAWREAVKSCHPDRQYGLDDEEMRLATDRLSSLNAAYELCRRRHSLTNSR